MEWNISPLDTFFFRGPQPLIRGEFTFLRSIFPPTPQTSQGFVRTAILKSKCKNIQLYSRSQCHNCSDTKVCLLPDTIGDPKDRRKPGKISLRGPYLMQLHGGRVRRLFPSPCDLISYKDNNGDIKYSRLAPTRAIECDLGLVSLPVTPDRFNTCDLITESGLQSYLSGEIPPRTEILAGRSTVIDKDNKFLWDPEQKVGIARDGQTHVAQNHMLYSIEMIRLRPGISLGIRVDGLSNELELSVTGAQNLGGEGRMASVSLQKESPLPIPKNLVGDIDKTGRFRLMLLQPADFDGSWLPPGFKAADKDGLRVWKGTINGFQLSLISACTGKPVKIGGWDVAARGPAPVKCCVPAGSVYYFQIDPKQGEKVVASFHDKCIGNREGFGFGHAAIGSWNEA